VYVAIVIAGALVGEKVVNNGFDSMWESRNKGKLFKHMTFPEPETEE
jgi:ubiquinol-cytochrome c reductase subunit 9|tara:strand:+ start:1735 stop:1875 length:141 start_codon:yes stop_codon:yes gene_type:complete